MAHNEQSFVQVGIAFCLLTTAAQFMNQGSLFVLLPDVIR
jgi:hypothetical protein